MHKFFAKTAFLGKNVISLPECHSTNDLLMDYARLGSAGHGTIVITEFQTLGKGQRGNQWESEPGTNLLFSLLLEPKFMEPKHQFYLSLSMALSTLNGIERLSGARSGLEVKWPNDLYLDDKKLGGILLESSLSGNIIEFIVLGMGLNVSQMKFTHPNATSLLKSGIELEKNELLEEILLQLETYLELLKSGDFDTLLHQYYARLRWLGEEHQFEVEGKSISATIQGIDDRGRLELISGGKTMLCNIKEIKFLR